MPSSCHHILYPASQDESIVHLAQSVRATGTIVVIGCEFEPRGGPVGNFYKNHALISYPIPISTSNGKYNVRLAQLVRAMNTLSISGCEFESRGGPFNNFYTNDALSSHPISPSNEKHCPPSSIG